MKNRYEDPSQRLHSHGWSKEYKENYEKIFGVKETWLDRRERIKREQEQKAFEQLKEALLPLMKEENDASSD